MDNSKDAIQYEYDAFISYRHTEPDITIAKKVMEMLEGYKAPSSIAVKSGIKKINRLFRDREELPTTTDLSESIMNALKKSKFLIVICSPRTPESKWVKKEIEIFKELHGAHKIQALLIEGEPQESFPEPLHYEVKKLLQEDGSYTLQTKELELLAADIRPEELKGLNRNIYGMSIESDKSILSKSINLLKTERLRCLAPMFGCRFDELYQRHLRRVVRNIALLSSVAIALFGAFTIYSVSMGRQIASQRDNALKSQSLFLSDLSKQQFAKGDRIVAAMLALDALPKDLSKPDRPYVTDAEAALWNAANYSSDKFIPYTILKHDSNINYANFNSDDTMIVTTSDDNTAIVWDIKTGRQISKLQGHTGKVYHAEFSPDSKKVVTSSADKTAIIWDTRTGKKIALLTGHTKEVTRAVFSPDGSKVVEATFDNDAIIWDVTSGKIIHTLKNGDSQDTQFFSAEFSPDGSKVVTTDNSSAVIIWDVATGKIITKVSFTVEETKNNAEFSSDGNRVLAMNCSGDTSNSAVILDTTTGKLLNTLDGHSKMYLLNARFNKDNSKVITCSEDKIVIWNAVTGQIIQQIGTNGQKLLDSDFSPDGKYIISEYRNSDALITIIQDSATFKELTRITSQNTTYDVLKITFISKFSSDSSKLITAYDNKSLYIWDTNADKAVMKLTGHTGLIRSLEYSANGLYLLTKDNDGKAILWDPVKGKVLENLNFKDSLDHDAAFSPDSSKIVVCTNDGTGILWDAVARKEIAKLSVEGGSICSAVFSPDSKRVVTATGDTTAIVWDASTGVRVAEIVSNISIFHAEYSPDGSKIVTVPFNGQDGGLVEIWDSSTCKQIAQLPKTWSPRAAVISPDSKKLATVLYDNAIIWDTATGKELTEYTVNDYCIEDCVFSPNSKQFITLLATKSPIVWDAMTGKKIFELAGHNDDVNIAKYSPDGSKVITASSNGTAIIWNALTGKEIIMLQGHNNYVTDAMFCPDGKMVVTIYNNNTSSIWNVANGIELERLDGSNARFSPDCKSIATAAKDGTIIIWPIRQLDDVLSYAKNMIKDRNFTEQEKVEFFLQ